ncbi:MAG: hypothetical protein RLZZ182_75, partial [Pseudomonadota bacterium]
MTNRRTPARPLIVRALIARALSRAGLLAALWPAAAPAAATPWAGLYQGQIGARQVTVALYPDEQQRLVGRYFDQAVGRDRLLWGPAVKAIQSGQPLVLHECDPSEALPFEPCEAPAARWTLPDSPARTGGQWKARQPKDGHPLPSEGIVLRRVSGYTPSASALHDPYEQARFRGIRAETRPGGQMGPARWLTQLDPRSDVRTVQLTAGGTPQARQRINAQLQQQWGERVRDWLTAVDHTDSLQVVFANPRWVTVTRSYGFYFAGAAHPAGGFEATTFNLRTGQPHRWAPMFRMVGQPGAPLDLQRTDLLPALALKAFVARQADRAGSPDDAACDALVLERYECERGQCRAADLTHAPGPQDWLMWPTDQGLAVAPDIYPEAARACRGTHVVLPWAELRA